MSKILANNFFSVMLFVCSVSHAAFGNGEIDTAAKLPRENFNFLNGSQSSVIIGKSEGWLLISEPGTTPVIYYAPLSISRLKSGFASVTSLINYTSDEGNAESLLGVSLYNCASATKQEQSTVQYSMHWADGDVKLRIGLEEPWNPVKVGTEGMRLLKVACDR
jgi:hypothetical protein